MKPARRIRLSLPAVALVLGLLAGCAEPKPPPPPPPPPVGLSPKLIEQAGAYRAYLARATAISPSFLDGAGVAQALQTGVAYEPQQLLRGEIAYAAIVALQDPVFVAAVRAAASDPVRRQQVAYEVLKDPAYALSFAGANGAAARVIDALGNDGRKLQDQGKLIRQAAYDVQHSPWSKADVPNREMRLSQMKTLSGALIVGDLNETLRLQQAAQGGAPLGLAPAPPVNPPYMPLVVRGLAVAALATLGWAGDDHVSLVTGVMSEPNAGQCLTLSKLNLYQCLAVSKPHYEDVFCLGQHALSDTGQCVMRSVGATVPLEIKTQPLAIAETPVAPKSGASGKASKKR
jgi:hypothetical protein